MDCPPPSANLSPPQAERHDAEQKGSDVWQTATILDGRAGIFVSGLPVGEQLVWMRALSAPETPVMQHDRMRLI